jgi:hypothetical protein
MSEHAIPHVPYPHVPGYCPMGCGQTLFAASGGHITCSWIECPDPCAVDTILSDPETHHIVTLREDDFSVKHPLRERVADALLTCAVHGRIAEADGPPAQLGTYRIRVPAGNGAWFWERLTIEVPA